MHVALIEGVTRDTRDDYCLKGEPLRIAAGAIRDVLPVSAVVEGIGF